MGYLCLYRKLFKTKDKLKYETELEQKSFETKLKIFNLNSYKGLFVIDIKVLGNF